MSALSAQNKVKVVSEKNSKKLSLGVGQSFIGLWEDVSDFSLATISVFIDVAGSEKCTLQIETAADPQGKNKLIRTILIDSTSAQEQQITIASQAMRVLVIANRNVPIVGGYVQTILHKHKAPFVTSGYLGGPADQTTTCSIVKAVMAGTKPNGTINSIATDSQGVLQVSIVQGGGGPTTGNTSTSSATLAVTTENYEQGLTTVDASPSCEISFLYNLNPSHTTLTTLGSGSFMMDSASTCGNISTGATSYSNVVVNVSPNILVGNTVNSAYVSACTIESKKNVRLNPGFGIRAVVSAFFTDPSQQGNATIGTYQYIGIGDASNGLFFGYNGQAFGILQRYGGALAVYSVNVTGGATLSGTCTIALNGNYTSFHVTSGDTVTTIVQAIVTSSFPGWKVYTLGNVVFFKAVYAEPKFLAFFFMDGGTGVAVSNPTLEVAGAQPIDIWTNQDTWSEDSCDGNGILPALIPRNGNMYQIDFMSDGFNVVTLSIINKITNKPSPVHTLKYPNTYTIPFLKSRILPLRASVENFSTPAHDIALRTPSMSIHRIGKTNPQYETPFWFFASLESMTFSRDVYTNTCILKNHILYQGVMNKTELVLSKIHITLTNSVYTSSVLHVVVSLNAQYSSTPTFTQPDANSSAMVSSDPTYVSGGKQVFHTSLACTTLAFDVATQNICIYPGNEISISVKPLSKQNLVNADFSIGLCWVEDR